MSWSLSPAETEALLLSLKVAGWSTLCSLPFGLFCAWILARRSFPGKLLLDGLIHLPLVLPPVAVGYLLLVLLGRNGPLGSWLFETLNITVAFTWKGAAIAAAVMSFPLMVRAIRLSMEGVDQGLEAAARTLGASRWQVFTSITLPLSAPGLLVGTVLAFARAIGEFGATVTFVSNIPGETVTLPLALFNATQMPGGEEPALRLMVLAVLVAIGALALSEVLARRLRARLHA